MLDTQVTRPVRAFTLIELLIVVAIIAILAAIAVPNFLEAQVRARVARAQSDMRSCCTAVECYAVDHGMYAYPMGFESAGGPGHYTYTVTNPTEEASEGYLTFAFTTPISYIAAIPNDVFENRDKDDHPGRCPYKYSVVALNATLNPHPPQVPDPANYVHDLAAKTGAGNPSAAAYMILTQGPDMEHQESLANAINYDATNGTLSKGDIYYFGPGFGFR